jgi:hypothetical protein
MTLETAQHAVYRTADLGALLQHGFWYADFWEQFTHMRWGFNLMACSDGYGKSSARSECALQGKGGTRLPLPFWEEVRPHWLSDPKHVSISYVERQNWTVRTTMRRYTRLSNGFSRKLQNHAAATALNYFAYNYIKIHRTLRTSPAMAAGVTDRLWDVNDLVTLWESYERRAERAA